METRKKRKKRAEEGDGEKHRKRQNCKLSKGVRGMFRRWRYRHLEGALRMEGKKHNGYEKKEGQEINVKRSKVDREEKKTGRWESKRKG